MMLARWRAVNARRPGGS